MLCRMQHVAIWSAPQVQFTTIQEYITKLFQDDAYIARSLQTESKVHTEDTVRIKCQIARTWCEDCKIFAPCSQHCSQRRYVMLYKVANLRKSVPNGTERG